MRVIKRNLSFKSNKIKFIIFLGFVKWRMLDWMRGLSNSGK